MTRPAITVVRVVGEAAVLRLEAYGQVVTLDWPLLRLPAGLTAGDRLEMCLLPCDRARGKK